MNDFAASFASLVKYNDGFFKSEKQASFLLSQCFGGVYYAQGNIYGNKFNIEYHCDEKGIVLVNKYSFKLGTNKTLFERGIKNKYAEKQIRRSMSLISDEEAMLVDNVQSIAEVEAKAKAELKRLVDITTSLKDAGEHFPTLISTLIKYNKNDAVKALKGCDYLYQVDERMRADIVKHKSILEKLAK